jgi:hypothetical protein
MRLQDRVLILTLCVQILILLNQTVALYHAGAQTASWVSVTPIGEDIGVKLSLDTGRPPTMLHSAWRSIRRSLMSHAPWLASWLVGGEPVTDAVVSISITVTGVNVESPASVEYYIEARPRGGGQPYRFLEATGVEVQVGGPSHVDVDDRGIGGHLEAMQLATTQTWTIDYYIYAKAEAVGAVSGKTLTCIIEETLFETKKYEPHTPFTGTWTRIPVLKSEGYMGYACFHNHSLNVPELLHMDYAEIFFGETPGAQYTSWLVFENGDAEKHGYGSTKLPSVEPGNLVIHEASIQLQAFNNSPPQLVTVHLRDSSAWVSTYADTYDKWLYRWGQLFSVTKTWSSPRFSAEAFYNTPDIGPLVQAYTDKYSNIAWRMTFFLTGDGDPQDTAKSFYGWYRGYDYWDRWPTLSIRWTEYEASWYPVQRIGELGIPFNITTLALLSLTAATALLWRENRRRMEAL